MAVLTHAVHERVSIEATRPYGCHNRPPFERGYHAPDRVRDIEEFNYQASYIPHVMSTDCRYDQSLTDPRCTGCKWRGTGEAYNEYVRAQGKA